MYKGFTIEVKIGQARDVTATTDEPFKWFPELEKLFENFNIKELEFEIETNEEGIARKFFKIVKVG